MCVLGIGALDVSMRTMGPFTKCGRVSVDKRGGQPC